jgi:triosephosphate isomerase
MNRARLLVTGQNIDIYKGDGQDAYARTGATSAEQLHRAGAVGVILGHSEVGDAPDVLRKKLFSIVEEAAGREGFLNNVTLLVGESWDEFEQRVPEEVASAVAGHLVGIIDGLPPAFLEKLVVGYEPKWGSRGSGRDDMPPPAPALISLVAARLKGVLSERFGAQAAHIPIIYGGRSTPERTKEILMDENVEGLILGSACNTVEKTMAIAKSMNEARPGKRKVLHANFKAYDIKDGYDDYVRALSTLDDTFIVYLSPSHTDIRSVNEALK